MKNIEQEMESLFSKTVKESDFTKLQILLKTNNVNLKDSKGHVPLMWAVYGGHKDIAELLLENGADVNLQGNSGNTPLLYAAHAGYADVVKLLLDRKHQNGLDINLQNSVGNTALMLAAGRGHKEVVQLLLDNGADINLINSNGRSALAYAANKKMTEVVKFFLDRKDQYELNVNLRNINGDTALIEASRKGYKDIVKLLLENGADTTIQDINGLTALNHATHFNRFEVAELLIVCEISHNFPEELTMPENTDDNLLNIITTPEIIGQKNPKYNIELAESISLLRNGIEFLPVFNYFTKEILYPITKDIIPSQLAGTKIFELDPYILSAAHLGASYMGAVALNLESPFEASLKASSSYMLRILSGEYLKSFSSLDLADDIKMAGYCSVNLALHFSSELLYLAGYMPKATSLKSNSLGYAQKLTVSTLECYNIYQEIHDNTKERAATKADQVLPYVADFMAGLLILGISYNPFFIVTNIVIADATSKLILNAIPKNIKTNLVDPILEHLGFSGGLPEYDSYDL